MNIIKQYELEKILDNLSGGGFLLYHHDRGTIIAERRAFHAANQFLGNKVERDVIDAFFKDAHENDKEFGYVSALIKLQHANNKELNEVRDMAKYLLDVVGVDKPQQSKTSENKKRNGGERLAMTVIYIGIAASVFGLSSNSSNFQIFGLTLLVFAGLLNIADEIRNSKQSV